MTEDGISNMIVSFNNIDGGANSLAALSGLQIKSDAGHGGLVQNILYKHNCIKNAAHPIRLMTTYEGKTATTHIPSYQNITFTENWITNDLSKGGEITFDGSGSNTPLTVTLGNVYTDNATIANGETSNSADAILKIVGAGINFSPHATKGNTTLSLLVDGKTIEPGAYTPNLSLTQNPGCTAEFAQMETSPPFPILWPPLD
jgi:polygalacturonase